MLWIATEGTSATAAGIEASSAGTTATAVTVTVAFNKNLYVENCLRNTPKNHINIAQTLD